jgi:hypothetical protein
MLLHRAFSHYVVRGDRHIDPNEEIIDEIWFVLDDATALFSDFGAFGSWPDTVPVFYDGSNQAATEMRHHTGFFYS